MERQYAISLSTMGYRYISLIRGSYIDRCDIARIVPIGKENTPLSDNYVSMHWSGGSSHPKIVASGPNAGSYLYLTGQKGTDLHTISTKGYNTLTYQDIYPGIDVVYTLPDSGGLKYNLVVHPGADASLIHMQYEGNISDLEAKSDGNLIISSPIGCLMEHAPKSYSAEGNTVPSRYTISEHLVTFTFPEGYDHTQLLIIDPWVTALNTLSIRNLGALVDYDLKGNLYVMVRDLRHLPTPLYPISWLNMIRMGM
jgi:hypothetical protein